MAKARRPRKGSAKLPKWFDIERYRSVKNFTAIDWFQQLGFRHFVENWLLDEALQNYLGKAWLRLLADDPVITSPRLEDAYPVLTVHEDRHDRGVPGGYMMDAISLAHEPAEPIGRISNAQLLGAYKKLPKQLTEARQAASPEWLKLYRAACVTPMAAEGSKHFIHVDISLPKNLLLKQFTEYLQRETRPPAHHGDAFFRNTDFSRWYNSGALPYLDLRLWELATGKTFQWTAFTEALNTISDKPTGSESAVQKTAKKYATKLLNSQTICILKMHATQEQNSPSKSGTLTVR